MGCGRPTCPSSTRDTESGRRTLFEQAAGEGAAGGIERSDERVPLGLANPAILWYNKGQIGRSIGGQ
jgi:hypothetical protein